MEVAAIAGNISRALRLNEDLTEDHQRWRMIWAIRLSVTKARKRCPG